MGQPKLRHAFLLARWLKHSLLPKRGSWSNKHSLLSSKLFNHAAKSPLSVIIGNLEFVEDGALNTEDKQRAAQRCLFAARRLEMLLSHIENPDKIENDVFDVKSAIDQVALIAEFRYPKSVVITDVPNCLLTGNKLYFQEAFQCLVNNGLDAQRRLSFSPKIIIIGTAMADKLRFDVIDMGHGMTLTETRLALMKGVTYRSDGSGLGLPFATDTIKRYFKGKLAISSSREIGTRVVVEIPI